MLRSSLAQSAMMMTLGLACKVNKMTSLVLEKLEEADPEVLTPCADGKIRQKSRWLADT